MSNKPVVKKTKKRFEIAKDPARKSSYYVTRTEGGKILDKTRVRVPARTNLFFKKTSNSNAA